MLFKAPPAEGLFAEFRLTCLKAEAGRGTATICEGLSAYTRKAMRPQTSFLRDLFAAPRAPEGGVARVDLVLRLPEGEPWIVSFSPGIERFIGYYPRLDEIAPEGTLLSFSRRGYTF
jgi:hypothetical protein